MNDREKLQERVRDIRHDDGDDSISSTELLNSQNGEQQWKAIVKNTITTSVL